MSSSGMFSRLAAFAQANPLAAALIALVVAIAAYLFLGDSPKQKGQKGAAHVEKPGLIKLPEDKAQQVAKDFDLAALRKDFYDDPFVVYHSLRDNEPLKVLKDKSIFITRYADVNQVYNGTKTFSSGKKLEFAPKYGVDSPLYEHHTTSLVFNDPPLHTRVRRILLGALTTKNFERMEPNIQRLVNELVDAAEKKGTIDLIEDFSILIPIEVIGNLLDVPHHERGPLRKWSLYILGALEPTLTETQMKNGNNAVTEFTTYLRELVRKRKEKPGDPEVDLLTRLLQGEKDGEKLTESELLQNCVFLLNAGHETTSNLIGNGLVALYQNQDQLRLLQSDPAKYMGTAIEELLRFQSPNQIGNRQATTTVTVGGMTLEKGTRVHLSIGAANRDPAQFENPDRLDITRFPNAHFAFASGVHRCLGEKLAKIEARIAIGGFIQRFPDYKVLEDKMVRSPRARFRGFIEVPCVVRP